MLYSGQTTSGQLAVPTTNQPHAQNSGHGRDQNTRARPKSSISILKFFGTVLGDGFDESAPTS